MKRLILSALILMPLHATNLAVHEFNPITTDQQKALDELRTKHRIVVIKFFSKTCPPCKTVAPHFEALAKELSSAAYFLAIDAHAYGSVSKLFNIAAVPSFVILAQGKQPVIIKGSQNLAAVRSTVETYIKEFQN